MDTLVLTIHVLACVLLICLVLLQSGHEGMGVIFGGGSSSMFGSTGAGGILVKATAVLAAIFLTTSLVYNLLTSRRGAEADSIMLKDVPAAAIPAPAIPDARLPGLPEQPAAPQGGK